MELMERTKQLTFRSSFDSNKTVVIIETDDHVELAVRELGRGHFAKFTKEEFNQIVTELAVKSLRLTSQVI